jgi:hypothetical protein
MATTTMTLLAVVRKGDDSETDFLRDGMRWLIHALMEADVSAQIGPIGMHAATSAPPNATAIAPACGTRASAPWNVPFPSSARAASSRVGWMHGDATNKH